MKHLQRKSTQQKAKEWLELCDFSFELLKNGFRQSTLSPETLALSRLEQIMKKKRSLNRKTLSKMVIK